MLATGVSPIVVSVSRASLGMSSVYTVPSAPVALRLPPSIGISASTVLPASRATATSVGCAWESKIQARSPRSAPEPGFAEVSRLELDPGTAEPGGVAAPAHATHSKAMIRSRATGVERLRSVRRLVSIRSIE